MWKLFRINNENNGVVPVSLLLTENIFQTCLIVDFEKANKRLPDSYEKIGTSEDKIGYIIRYVVVY